jgi:hypothetical protein
MPSTARLRQIDRLAAIPRDEGADNFLIGITRNEADGYVGAADGRR